MIHFAIELPIAAAPPIAQPTSPVGAATFIKKNTIKTDNPVPGDDALLATFLAVF